MSGDSIVNWKESLYTIQELQINLLVTGKYLSLRKHAHAINRDFLALKIENFQLKIFDIFLIFAQNIDCGYTLEQPRYIKVGFKGVYITRTCFPDV